MDFDDLKIPPFGPNAVIDLEEKIEPNFVVKRLAEIAKIAKENAAK